MPTWNGSDWPNSYGAAVFKISTALVPFFPLISIAAWIAGSQQACTIVSLGKSLFRVSKSFCASAASPGDLRETATDLPDFEALARELPYSLRKTIVLEVNATPRLGTPQ